MAEIYLLTIKEAEKIPEGYCFEHFPERLMRANSFRRREDYLRCIGAGALLHGILGVREKDLVVSEFGKLSDPMLGRHFSLSHSGDYILLAVDKKELGADIEYIDPHHAEVAVRVCTNEELNWIRGRDPEAFFTLWTLKESVMKYTGRGMHLDAGSFSVLPLAEKGEMCFEGKRLYAKTKTAAQHRLSVCAESRLDGSSITAVTAEMLL